MLPTDGFALAAVKAAAMLKFAGPNTAPGYPYARTRLSPSPLSFGPAEVAGAGAQPPASAPAPPKAAKLPLMLPPAKTSLLDALVRHQSVPPVPSSVLPERTGVWAGETGLGVPISGPSDARPLSAADRAALASAESSGMNRYAGNTGAPKIGGKPRLGGSARLLSALRSRPGKLGILGGIGLTGGSLALGGLENLGKSVGSPEPSEIAAGSHNLGPREVVRKHLLHRTGDAVGHWWNRMRSRYGMYPPETQA